LEKNLKNQCSPTKFKIEENNINKLKKKKEEKDIVIKD
jgi:hypothetical protein